MTSDKIPASGQLSMFPPQPDIMDVARANASVLSADFMEWLPDNLHVWDAFVYEAFKIIQRGIRHYSSYTIVEFLRHHTAVSEQGGEWKINNNYRPYLPRLFDAAYPRHAGLFEYRTTTKPKAA